MRKQRLRERGLVASGGCALPTERASLSRSSSRGEVTRRYKETEEAKIASHQVQKRTIDKYKMPVLKNIVSIPKRSDKPLEIRYKSSGPYPQQEHKELGPKLPSTTKGSDISNVLRMYP
jgi:hypothetical protein